MKKIIPAPIFNLHLVVELPPAGGDGDVPGQEVHRLHPGQAAHVQGKLEPGAGEGEGARQLEPEVRLLVMAEGARGRLNLRHQGLDLVIDQSQGPGGGVPHSGHNLLIMLQQPLENGTIISKLS